MASPDKDDLPKEVWRISNHVSLDGRGGLVASGRWHTKPKPIVYCADEAYTAYSECLRHIPDGTMLPDRSQLLKISVPGYLEFETIHLDYLAKLDKQWDAREASEWTTCQTIGNEWLEANRTPILKGPSVARPNAFNYLLNPAHRDFDALKIVEKLQQPFPTWVTRQP
jgi:RES domain-containing protein